MFQLFFNYYFRDYNPSFSLLLFINSVSLAINLSLPHASRLATKSARILSNSSSDGARSNLGNTTPHSFSILLLISASSVGTLPLNIECAEKMGARKDITSFVLPLGATINMDGTAIYQGVCTVFIAAMYGITLTPSQLLTVVLTATLASIGTAGVPGAGMVMLTMVLQSVGLPVEGIALVAGVDRIFDMGRTTVNITGDAACTLIVSNLENRKEARKASKK